MVLGQLAILTVKRAKCFGVEVDSHLPLPWGPYREVWLSACLWGTSPFVSDFGPSVGSALALCLLWEGTRKVGLSPLPPLLGMKGSGEPAGSAGRLHSGSGLQA